MSYEHMTHEVSSNFSAALAAAFYSRAQETSDGPEKTCRDILGISLSKLIAIATQSETQETLKDVSGSTVRYGAGFTSDQIMDVLLFIYGGIIDRNTLLSAWDRAAYRRRMASKSAISDALLVEEVSRYLDM